MKQLRVEGAASGKQDEGGREEKWEQGVAGICDKAIICLIKLCVYITLLLIKINYKNKHTLGST